MIKMKVRENRFNMKQLKTAKTKSGEVILLRSIRMSKTIRRNPTGLSDTEKNICYSQNLREEIIEKVLC